MTLSVTSSAVTPAVPSAPGISHLKRFGLTVRFQGLDDQTDQIVLGAAASVPAVYGDFTQVQRYRLLDADRLQLSQGGVPIRFAGTVFLDLDGGDWSAGDALYVCFVGTTGVPGPTEPLLAVQSLATVT